LVSLDEAEGMETLELLTFERWLKGEVEVGEGLDRGQAGRAHRRLETPIIAQGDLRTEERFDGRGRRQRTAIDACEDAIQRLERPRHLEISELRANPLAEGGAGEPGAPGAHGVACAHRAPPASTAYARSGRCSTSIRGSNAACNAAGDGA